MKRIIKKFLKCLIVYIVIGMTLLSGISYGYSSQEVGAAVAGYALNLLKWGNDKANYCDGLGGYGPALRYNQCGSPKNRLSHPTLKDPNPETPWFYDCSSFTAAMYNMVCNKEVFSWSATTSTFGSYTDRLDNLGPVGDGSKCLPGDIICAPDSHVEIFISQELGTGGAHSNHAGNVNAYSNSEGQVNCRGVDGSKSISPSSGNIYRLKDSVASTITDLNTEFSMGGAGGTSSGPQIEFSDFYFNGKPDGKYSIATNKNLFQIAVEAISELVNYLTGLISYLFRGFIIGIISIFDRLLNNTVDSISDSPKTLQQSGVSATNADDPYSMNRSVTIEGLIFNNIDLFDINIFKAE